MECSQLKSSLVKEVPEKLKGSLVLCERFFNFVYLLSSNNNFYEIKDRHILSSCFLEFTKDENEEQFTEKMQVDIDNLSRLQVYCSYENSVKNVFILVLIQNHLFVIKKKDDLKVIKVFNYVNDIQIVDELNDGGCKVEIQIGTETLTTDFSEDSDQNNSRLSFKSFPALQEVLLDIKKNTIDANVKLQTIENSMDQMYHAVDNEGKFLPNSYRSDCMDEKVPLIKYGDIWTKIYNERLVIGVPILNCTYKRKFVLENLKVIVECFESNYLEYDSKLFKMRTDCCSFEKFEELFDQEDEEKNTLEFNQDWSVCKVNDLTNLEI